MRRPGDAVAAFVGGPLVIAAGYRTSMRYRARARGTGGRDGGREALERGLDLAGTAVEPVGPAMLTLPTPCTEWNVRDLLNHLVGQLWTFHGRLTGAAPRYAVGPGDLPDADLVGDDAHAAYREVAEAVLAAADEPGALERAGFAASAYITDVVVHGWDLAMATGQDFPVDDALATYCLDFVRRGITEENRAPMFRPEVEVEPNSAAMEQLVAFLGRAQPQR